MSAEQGRGRGFFIRQLESGYSTDLKTEDDRSKKSPAQPPVGGRGKFMQILQVRDTPLDYSTMLAMAEYFSWPLLLLLLLFIVLSISIEYSDLFVKNVFFFKFVCLVNCIASNCLSINRIVGYRFRCGWTWSTLNAAPWQYCYRISYI